ncbi:FAS1 domain-containing protein [Fusarium oxysporum Fo47]|uniref:FAS1 domain-containing protein n=1 Tax=Fusarium oxysporum Fo47 TaxID=660027 RepID=UPI002869813C|nr:FAS1 domain-containing protein [Fusarium oxysporum Fo47]WJG35922.1 FAS1 domain-containing protein [Fusarium oxysporum Fo47]
MMKFQNFLLLTLTRPATGQNSRPSNSSLIDVLVSNNHILSVLNGILEERPGFAAALESMIDVTILAPSDDAIRSFLNNATIARMLASDSGAFEAVLSYHVLNGIYSNKNFTETPMFIETMLQNSTFGNVTGVQVVEAKKDGDAVSFHSTLKTKANITQADLKFTGGVVHIINRVLEIPMNLSATTIAANLTAVTGAISAAHLTNDLIDMQNIMVFAPNNGAFAAIASVVGSLSDDDLQSILQYHIVQGRVEYSTTLENGTLRTVEGSDLNISVEDGTIYVDEARVILPDVLISNGVVHVVDNVLNPHNTIAIPSTLPAFSDASAISGGNVPFTSNVPMPTETATGLVILTGSRTATFTDSGVPHATAAVAFGALFGGVAIVMNGLQLCRNIM